MAGVAAVLMRRRRRDLVVVARAVRWPPPGLTPAAVAVLASTGRRALPAAATPLDDADARDPIGDPTGRDGAVPGGSAAPSRRPQPRGPRPPVPHSYPWTAPPLISGDKGVGLRHQRRQLHRPLSRSAAPKRGCSQGVASEDLKRAAYVRFSRAKLMLIAVGRSSLRSALKWG